MLQISARCECWPATIRQTSCCLSPVEPHSEHCCYVTTHTASAPIDDIFCDYFVVSFSFEEQIPWRHLYALESMGARTQGVIFYGQLQKHGIIDRFNLDQKDSFGKGDRASYFAARSGHVRACNMLGNGSGDVDQVGALWHALLL